VVVKTALELLGFEVGPVGIWRDKGINVGLELVASRAREEMRYAAYALAFDAGVKLEICDAIRALPTEPGK